MVEGYVGDRYAVTTIPEEVPFSNDRTFCDGVVKYMFTQFSSVDASQENDPQPANNDGNLSSATRGVRLLPRIPLGDQF